MKNHPTVDPGEVNYVYRVLQRMYRQETGNDPRTDKGFDDLLATYVQRYNGNICIDTLEDFYESEASCNFEPDLIDRTLDGIASLTNVARKWILATVKTLK